MKLILKKNTLSTSILWIASIAATAYLFKGQESVGTLIIILVILGAVNITIINEKK
jgi:hypothetical protein